MSTDRPSRIRVFAGPNGSGKSTLLRTLKESAQLPLYRVINPDDIETRLNSKQGLSLAEFGLTTTRGRFHKFVESTSYPARAKRAAESVRVEGSRLYSAPSRSASYNAALVAAFVRALLIRSRESFSYESVFSHPSKLDELKKATAQGYRVYLYFVAMDAADLCVGRVKERVASGGHGVPEEKIRKRYTASLENLLPALALSYRGYIFDNSGREAVLLAEKTCAGNLNLKNEHLPVWFKQHVIDRLTNSRSQ